MATAATYYIPSKHMDFKKLMFQLGYKDQIAETTCKNKVIYFPNTTLYHANKGAEAAREDARSVANKLGVIIEK